MKTIFVMVGHPCHKAPAPFTMVEIAVEEGQEIKQAKLHRADVTKHLENFHMARLREQFGMKFPPADFFWAIFNSPIDEKPFAASDNYYWRQDKKQRPEVSQEIPEKTIEVSGGQITVNTGEGISFEEETEFWEEIDRLNERDEQMDRINGEIP